MAKFSVGEVATLIRPDGATMHNEIAPYIGQGVEIIGTRMVPGWGLKYDTKAADGHEITVTPRCLKKRPPKESKDISETRANPITFDDCAWQPEGIEYEKM